VPWSSDAKSRNAVRGCYGAAGKNPKKRAKCRKMAHHARLWRKGRMKHKRTLKRSRKMARRR